MLCDSHIYVCWVACKYEIVIYFLFLFTIFLIMFSTVDNLFFTFCDWTCGFRHEKTNCRPSESCREKERERENAFFVARLWIIVTNCTRLFGRPRHSRICANRWERERVQRVSNPMTASMVSLGNRTSRRLRQMSMINPWSMYFKCTNRTVYRSEWFVYIQLLS